MANWINEELFFGGISIPYDTTGGLWLSNVFPWQELLPWQFPGALFTYDNIGYTYNGFEKKVWDIDTKNTTSWSKEVATPTTWIKELQA